jgi:hypothetical protein
VKDHSPIGPRAPRAAARLLAALGLALAALPAAAHAQFGVRTASNEGRTQVYEWSGRVDREVRIELRGNRAYTDAVGSNDRGGRAGGRLLRPIPRERGTLRVQRLDGRGSVDVIQQPNAGNGYTAVVRLRDPSSGADRYRVAAYWVPADGVYGGNDDRRGRDGRYDDRDGRYDDRDGGYDDRDERYDDRDGRYEGRRDDRYEDRRRDRRDRREDRRDRRRGRSEDHRRDWPR